MCKHKHALKGKMIRGIQRRCSPDPRLTHIQLFPLRWEQSPLFISHMARPPLLLAQERSMPARSHAEKKKDGPERKLSWWQ